MLYPQNYRFVHIDAHNVLNSSLANSKDRLVKIKRERQVVLLNKLSFFFFSDLIVYILAVSVSPLC